jgi:hypothetical protein
MEFRVHTPDDTESSFHGSSTYAIGNANAVLTVNDEIGHRKITYSPSAWLRVVEGDVDDDLIQSVH